MIEPWKEPDSPWKTEAAFYSFLRGGLRRGLWNKHPLKLSYKRSQRFKVPLGRVTKANPKGLVWACKCAVCEEVYREPEIEVDHILPAGGLSSVEDIKAFVIRLSFIDYSVLRLLCLTCHAIVTHQQRTGMNWDEAVKDKTIKANMPKKVGQQKEFLFSQGFSDEEVKNTEKRKQCYDKLYEEGQLNEFKK